jgi:hypothetical protein
MVDGWAIDPWSSPGRNLVHSLLADGIREPYLHVERFPELVDDRHSFVGFLIEGEDPMSDLGRAVEGTVVSAEWSVSPQSQADARRDIELTTTWFVLIDLAVSGGATAVGAMSVADCCRGPSETLRAAETVAARMGVAVPAELQVQPADHDLGLWDVMQLSVLSSHRGTRAAAWLQHMLYRGSIEAGVSRWVANMTVREFDMLRAIGIPFELVADLEGTDFLGETDHGGGFGFQTIDVRTIRSQVSQRIGELLGSAETESPRFSRLLADLASISINGCSTARLSGSAPHDGVNDGVTSPPVPAL